jgi:hypothetical protein
MSSDVIGYQYFGGPFFPQAALQMEAARFSETFVSYSILHDIATRPQLGSSSP